MKKNRLPSAQQALIQAFSDLPGIGEQMAGRLVQHCLSHPEVSKSLSDALSDSQALMRCERCQAWSNTAVCHACQSAAGSSLVVVLDMAQRQQVLERIQSDVGLFVLHQCLSPMSGVGPDELGLSQLVHLVKQQGIEQVVCALPKDTAGRLTTQFINDLLAPFASVYHADEPNPVFAVQEPINKPFNTRGEHA